MRIFLLMFIVFPVVELMLLIEVGSKIGGLLTIACVLLTAFVGLALIRQQGLSILLKAREKMHQGNIPASEVVEALLLAIAGVFLLFPGFISDALGFLLIIPTVRKGVSGSLMGKVFKEHFTAQSRRQKTPEEGQDHGDVIEGEFTKDDKALLEDNNLKN